MTKSINTNTLYSYLDASMGDRHKLAKRLIDVYITNSSQRLETMRDNLAISNFLGVRMEAHSIKSSSKMLGADEVMEICAKIESLCDGAFDEKQSIPKLIEDLVIRLESAKEELKKHPILSENPLA